MVAHQHCVIFILPMKCDQLGIFFIMHYFGFDVIYPAVNYLFLVKIGWRHYIPRERPVQEHLFFPIQSYIECPELPPCGVIRDTPLWGFRWCPMNVFVASKYPRLKLEVTTDLCFWVTGYPIIFKHQKKIKRSKKCLEFPRLTVPKKLRQRISFI